MGRHSRQDKQPREPKRRSGLIGEPPAVLTAEEADELRDILRNMKRYESIMDGTPWGFLAERSNEHVGWLVQMGFIKLHGPLAGKSDEPVWADLTKAGRSWLLGDITDWLCQYNRKHS